MVNHAINRYRAAVYGVSLPIPSVRSRFLFQLTLFDLRELPSFVESRTVSKLCRYDERKHSKPPSQTGARPDSIKGKLIFPRRPRPRSRLRICFRETGSAVPSRVSLLTSILTLNLVLTYGIPPEVRGGVHLLIPPYAIGSVPSLSGHAIAYRWRSLPRVRWHRASKPQGSSGRVLPWQVTTYQLIYASLSHTH